MRLADFLTQIAAAAQIAGREARRTAQRSLQDAVEAHPKNAKEMRFRRIAVRLPGPTLAEDNGPLLQIPAYGLLTGGNLDLGKMTAEVEAEINLTGAEATNGEAQPAEVLSLEMRKGMFKRSASVKITMEFEMGDAPEIAEVVRDRLTQQLNEALKQESTNG